MSVNTDSPEMNLELKKDLVDTSVSDAKWLLGSVAALGLFVILTGLFASTLAV